MKYSYSKAKNFSELSGNNGLVSTPLDFKTFAKDIPCQNACPAKTNVPLYIEQIFKGNEDAAYRINLEDNVFPGVLGRICTRPCESACRHNWTNIQGPVQICHLKRISGDFYKTPVEPLSSWYKSSGKKVAVVGGGPAGLTAARELQRYGHNVTLFERDSKLGGMLINGIPKFRLPREVIQSEIEIITKSGITVELNADITFEKILQLKKDFDEYERNKLIKEKYELTLESINLKLSSTKDKLSRYEEVQDKIKKNNEIDSQLLKANV